MAGKAVIPRLNMYSWGANFARFCDRFKDYVQLTDSKELIDLLFLSNVCEETWVKLNTVKIENEDRNDVQKVIDFYKAAYNAIEDRRSFQATFMMIKQGQEESVEAYGRRLDELAAKAYPNEIVQNEVKTPTFIRGLKDNRIKLQLVQGDALAYSQVVRAAVRCEQASIILEPQNIGIDVFSTDRVDTSSRVNIENQSNNESVTYSVDRVNDRTNYNSKKVNNNARSERMKCWTCNSEEHVQRDCKLIKCYICEGPHLKRNCPKQRNIDNSYQSNGGNRGYNRGENSFRTEVYRGYNRGENSFRTEGNRGYNRSDSYRTEGNNSYRQKKCTFCFKNGHEEVTCWFKPKNGPLN